MHIQREILIKASKDKIKNVLIDLKQMVLWSPWNIIEPDATVLFNDKQSEVGAFQEWDGELIGAGNTELIKIDENKIDYDLTFIKPFKSKAKFSFILEEIDDEIKVIWSMDSSLPWYMFFFTKMMSAMIGMDYDKGLRMLKEYIETGKILSKLEIDANSNLEDISYIGIKNEIDFQGIGETMKNDFKALIDFAIDNNLLKEDTKYFSIYNKFDIVKQEISYIAAIQVSEDVNIPEHFLKSKIKQTKAIKVRHTGAYENLGNAWSLAMMYPRAKKLKINKKPMGYEFYLNSPNDTEKENLVCDIFVSLK